MGQQSRLISRKRQARTARIMHAACTDHPTSVSVCMLPGTRTWCHQRKDKTEQRVRTRGGCGLGCKSGQAERVRPGRVNRAVPPQPPARGGPNLLAAAYKMVEWWCKPSTQVIESTARARSQSVSLRPPQPKPPRLSLSLPLFAHGHPRRRERQRARGVAVRAGGQGGQAGRGGGQDEHPGGAVQDQRERGRARPAARAAAGARGPLGVPGLPHRRRGRGRRGRRAPDGQVQLLPRRRRPPRRPPVRFINFLLSCANSFPSLLHARSMVCVHVVPVCRCHQKPWRTCHVCAVLSRLAQLHVWH